MAWPGKRNLVLTAAAAIVVGILVPAGCKRGNPPAAAPSATPAPPSPSPAPDAPEPATDASASAAPAPTSMPAPAELGAVYEVTLPRPSPIPQEAVPTTLDLARPENRDVTPPVLIQRVEPRYPEAARQAGAAGIVTIEGIITERGEVTSPRVVKSTTDAVLNEAALQAVRQWRYQPARRRGQPVPVYVTLSVTFRLH